MNNTEIKGIPIYIYICEERQLKILKGNEKERYKEEKIYFYSFLFSKEILARYLQRKLLVVFCSFVSIFFGLKDLLRNLSIFCGYVSSFPPIQI
jgi:hypothetical protein